MNSKWIGAILILASSSSVGFSVVLHAKRDEHMLAQLELVLDEMLLELPFRLTPLPELVRSASHHASGAVKRILILFAEQLERQVLPDAESCMTAAMSDESMKYEHTGRILSLIGRSIGRFDLSGQMAELSSVKNQCTQELCILRSNWDSRLKSCRILCICAGIALVILLI